ncbi:MAG: sensor histidine kinase [Bacteriovoracaceae bacterium]
MFKTTPKRWLLGLTILWMTTILALGVWWLFLLVKFSTILNASNQLPSGVNFVRLVKYEGGSFLLLLILISSTLIYLYFQELKQTNSVRAFFASLTHELKTPLASMRLQAEVMHDLIENNMLDSVHDYAHRLIDDGKRLELEMDKILHLSRVQRGGRLNITAIDLSRYGKNLLQKNYPELKVHWAGAEDEKSILADDFALSLVLRNLVDNSIKHCSTPNITFQLEEHAKGIRLIYSDGGVFTGKIKKLGTLFYKHNSPKGSGIGLYLIKELMRQMHGEFSVTNGSPLTLVLDFKKEGKNA